MTPNVLILFFIFYIFYLLISRRIVTWEQDVTCWHHPQVYSCIWKEPGASAQRRDAELFWRMELIVVHLFWLCYPQVSLGPVRLCPSSTLEFWDLYANRFEWNADGGFCKGERAFSFRAGDLIVIWWCSGRGESQRKKFMWPFFL